MTVSYPDYYRRWIGKCGNGHTVTMFGEQADLVNGWAYQCGCGRYAMMKIVSGKRGKRACGAWCTDATTAKCTCECGGNEHGATAANTWVLANN